jgi:hypothetical protein
MRRQVGSGSRAWHTAHCSGFARLVERAGEPAELSSGLTSMCCGALRLRNGAAKGNNTRVLYAYLAKRIPGTQLGSPNWRRIGSRFLEINERWGVSIMVRIS